jgi:hypothetical protein
MFFCPHQTAGQNYNFMIANNSFRNVAKFKYLGMLIDRIQVDHLVA